jgi:hypothetical protein
LIERFAAMSQMERGEMRQRGLDSYRRRYSLSNAAAEVYRALGLKKG